MLSTIKKSLNGVIGGVYYFPASLGDLRYELEQQPLNAYNVDPYHEVYPGIFLGDAEGARDVIALDSLGITHILNAAFGKDPLLYVDTDKKFYTDRSFPCDFKGVPAIDIHFFNLNFFFYEAADFIEAALTKGGKVYVHCFLGVSRSATLVIVYLMIKQKIPAVEAVKLVRYG